MMQQKQITEDTCERNMSMDMLRCIAMLFIIIHHLFYNGLEWNKIYTLNGSATFFTVGSFFECCAIIGVNLFFMMSGFFGIHFKWNKVWTILINLFAYSIIIQSVGLLTGYNKFERETILRMLLPLKDYWFILVYLFLMVLSPLLNSMIEKQNEESAKKIFVLAIALVGFLTFVFDSEYIGVNRGYSLISACFMYICGGFIRRRLIFSKISCARTGVIIWITINLINFLMMAISINCLQNGKLAALFLMYNNPLVIMATISFFCTFNMINISSTNCRILKLGKKTLPVYIIHSSNKVVPYYRNMPLKWLVENNMSVIATVLVFPYSILIFVACACVDILFQMIFGKVIMKLSDKLSWITEYIIYKVALLCE